MDVTSQYLGRLILGMVTMAGAASLQAQAADGSTSDEYGRTLSALERYRVLADQDDGEILPATKKPVEPGAHYTGVPRVRRLLSLLGIFLWAAFPAMQMCMTPRSWPPSSDSKRVTGSNPMGALVKRRWRN